MAGTLLVKIDGKTPAGAACAAVLARAGVRVHISGAEETVGGLALVSRSVLDALGVAGAVSARRIERVLERMLFEDSASDISAPKGDLVVARTAEIVAALLGVAESAGTARAEEPGLRVDASEFRLGDRKLQDDDFLPLSALEQVVQLEWATGRDGPATWIRMTGDPLREVTARADLVVTSDRTALIVSLPTNALVETSITLPDIVSRLLAHPSVAAEIPAEEPVMTATRLLKTDEAVHFALNGDIQIRIGAAAGLADPVLLDRELRSGIAAGTEISGALAESRVSLARLSRLSRVKRAEAVNPHH
jgi:hypothetical protein